MISGNGCVCNSSSLIITLSTLWKEHLPPNNINTNVLSDVTTSIAQPMQLKPQHTYELQVKIPFPCLRFQKNLFPLYAATLPSPPLLTDSLQFTVLSNMNIWQIYKTRQDKNTQIYMLTSTSISTLNLKHNCRALIQCVPLATEPGISLIILTPIKILQQNLNRSIFVV